MAASNSHIGWQLAELGNLGRERLASDPTSSGAAQLTNLGRGVEIISGRVVDSIAYLHAYKVLPERGLACMMCTYLAPGVSSAIGAKTINTLPPGTRVWFIYHRELLYGLIIGVEPDYMTDGKYATSDCLYLGSRSGLHRDSAHSFPLQIAHNGVVDWSAGRPFDSTTAGEWGAMTETGMRVTLDSFMAQLGVGEACGVFAYYWDQLLRIAGTNLQIRSSTFEHESLDDESEHFDVIGRSVYPWESLGAGRQQAGLFREHTAKQFEIDEPWYGPVEPKYDDQVPLRRTYEFHGYLGQGGKRVLLAPTNNAIARQSNPAPMAALFSEAVTLTGRYLLSSAKGITISRRVSIPAVKPKKRPEHADGDNTDNYKASSAFGSGPEHVVKSAPAMQEADDPSLVRAAAVQDLHSYTFNWESPHPFHYHEQDWDLDEESECELSGDTPPIPFADLANHQRMYLPEPPTASIEVDHRYRTVEYALATSYLTLLDDGGVVLGSGCGCEIRMAGGSISISAPGDIWTKPGRNAVTWAGRDAILRAKRHVDITSTDKDVRIKAERHLWALAGNSGSSGMLFLESRASQQEFLFENNEGGPMIGEDAQAGGVVIRTPDSNFVTWAKDIYLRTGGGSVQDGNITLDASEGRRVIVTESQATVNLLTPSSGSGRFDVFHDEGKVKSVHATIHDYLLLNGNLAVLGFAAVDGKLYTNDWIYVDTGHIATADAPKYMGLVQAIKPESMQPFFDALGDAETRMKFELTDFYESAHKQRWRVDYRAGNARVMEICEFSFRTPEQYGTQDDRFRLYEDRWQQLARLGGAETQTWQEQFVETQGTSTGPYPGREVAQKEGSYQTVGLTIYDAEAGHSKDRGTAADVADCYENPKYATPQKTTLENGYTILG